MRNSNKLLALALAAALVLGTATTAFAAEEGKDGETAPTAATTTADGADKKDDADPAEDADKADDAAPAEDADKADDAAPAEDADKADDADPADDADKTDDAAPADDEDKADDAAPADGEDSAAPTVTYTDVAGRWFADSVNFVTEKKLMDGLTETTFGPDEKMTRQMLAVALYRLAGSPEVTAENPFTDVADDAAYKDAVVWAYSVGVVNGVTETTFNPDSTIQRQAIAAMLARYLGVTAEEGDLSAFTDADAIQDYAKAAMSWAAKNELLKGDTKGAVDPRGEATRAQVATILERFAPMAEGKAPAAPADDAAAPAGDDAAPAGDTTTPADTDKKDDAAQDEDKKDDAADKTDDAGTADDTSKPADGDSADDTEKPTEGDKADDSADKE